MVVRPERGGQIIVEDGSIDGPKLIRVCQQIIADDKRAPPGLLRWLRLRARSEVRGDNLTDILLDLSRHRFYMRITALALRLVAVLKARQNMGDHVESPLAPRCSKASQAS